VQKLRKQGRAIAPVVIAGTRVAATFWGKAWCKNLESYHDYENRLPRGRSYVRNGAVLDLQIAPHEVTALVKGSSVYKVAIRIAEVPGQQWQSICRDCTGGIDSLVELLQGRFSKAVMERLCRQDEGLFPHPSHITFSCNCYDYAAMCKHVAAVLYGIGARLDQQPELLFRLRAVDEKDLLAHFDAGVALSKEAPAADRILDAEDMSALFGFDLDDGEGAVVAMPVPDRTDAKAVAQEKPSSAKPAGKKAPATKPAPPPSKPVEPAPEKAVKAVKPRKKDVAVSSAAVKKKSLPS
jgi:uncharacterized Zn finger protein